MIFDIIFMVGSILTIIVDTNFLMAGRFIQGLSIGAFFTIPPVYLSEITPLNSMGIVGALMGVAPSSALMISFTLGDIKNSQFGL
jgi:MFS family permease